MNKVKKRSKRKRVILGAVIAMLMIIFTFCFILLDNKNVQYEYFEIGNADNGKTASIKIAHLSDLHFPKIKVDIDSLTDNLVNETPDIIAITGDLIDQTAEFDDCGVIEFVDRLVLIAPVYYINGNHEVSNGDSIRLYEYLEKCGVVVLFNRSVNAVINGKTVSIVGLRDKQHYLEECYTKSEVELSDFILLLAHRPDYDSWIQYTEGNGEIKPDLILSGHVHGGQIRIFGRGLLCPDRMIFPKIDAGIYVSDNEKQTKMIVSRGIGNSIVPIRFNNKPHVPIISVYV